MTATLDPFTADELDEIKALTKNTLWIQSDKFNDNVNSDFENYEKDGTWVDAAGSDGKHTFGWWEIWYGSDYGGHYIIYPEGTAVGQEVDATYRFRISSWYPVYNLDGKAKILQDDDTKKVMIWWNVDLEKECINRGWIVKMK